MLALLIAHPKGVNSGPEGTSEGLLAPRPASGPGRLHYSWGQWHCMMPSCSTPPWAGSRASFEGVSLTHSTLCMLAPTYHDGS